jgi:hypothetical protein
MAEIFRAADAVREVDLVDYAQKNHGYAVRARDSGWGVAVLENAPLNDCVAIARDRQGQWIYATVPDYTLRGEGEPVERAFARLRESIARSPSTGGVVEFAAHVQELRRTREAERSAALAGASERADDGGKGALNRRMYGIEAPPVAGAATPQQVAERRRHFEEVNRAIDARTAPARPRAAVQELEAFSLLEHARRQGYDVRLGDGAPGLAVLEHRTLGDRVAIARGQDGAWMYADVRAYAPRGEGEPSEQALARVRGCIEQSPSTGDAVAFAARAEGLRRGAGAQLAAARARSAHTVALEGAGGGHGAFDPKRELGRRHTDLKPVVLEGTRRGRGPDRGR